MSDMEGVLRKFSGDESRFAVGEECEAVLWIESRGSAWWHKTAGLMPLEHAIWQERRIYNQRLMKVWRNLHETHEICELNQYEEPA